MEDNKQEQKPKVPFYKKWWFWLIIGLVVVGIIGSIVGGTAGGSSSNNGNNNSSNSSQSSTYGMNQKVTVRNLEFTITGAYDTKMLGSSSLGATTENNFVVVTIVVKNISSSEITLLESNFRYYRGSNSYEAHSGGIYLDNGFYVTQSIGAGITKTIKVAYEIPSEYQKSDYVLVKDSYKSEKIYLK